MTAPFDLRTVFLVGSCTTMLAVLTFVALHRMYARALPALHAYALAMLCTATALALGALRNSLPEWAGFVASNALVSVGSVLVFEGTRRLFGKSTPQARLAALIAAGALLWIWFGNEPTEVRQRVITMSAMQFAFSAAIALIILRAPEFGRLPYVRALFVFFAAFGSINLARGLHALFDAQVLRDSVFAPNPLQLAFGVFFALSPIAFALLIQMVLHARISSELHRRATTDDLTGLLSRGHFFDLVREELQRPSNGGRVRHLLMIDLDHFKSINDLHGHSAGDQALQHAARVLQDALGHHGLLGRYGGEEFCALIVSNSPAAAEYVVERMHKGLESAPLLIDSARLRLTASIGTVPVAGPDSLERALVLADQCVYRAKTEGRNRVVRFGVAEAEPVV